MKKLFKKLRYATRDYLIGIMGGAVVFGGSLLIQNANISKYSKIYYAALYFIFGWGFVAIAYLLADL